MTLKFINVVSTKRSGHHAFIQWLQEHTPGAKPHFINNTRLGENLRNLLRREADGATSFIMNYEGATLNGVASMIAQQQALGGSIKTIIFLRDPLNMTASLVTRKPKPALELVMLLRQILAEYRLLQLCPRTPDGKPAGAAPFPIDHIVFYSPWLRAPKHRATLAAALDLAGDGMVGKVSQYGGGSSYDSKSEYSDVDAIRLLSRWRASKSATMFQALIAHPRFAPVFQNALDGQLTDSFGGGFADPEGAAFLRETVLHQHRNRFANAYISHLLEQKNLFAKIEKAGGVMKKLLIARATLSGAWGAFSARSNLAAIDPKAGRPLNNRDRFASKKTQSKT